MSTFICSLISVFYLCVTLSLSLVVSLHYFTLSFSQSHLLLISHTPSLPHTHAHTHTLSPSHTPSLPTLLLSLSHSLPLSHSMSQGKRISGQETLPLNPSQFWNQRPKFLQSCHRTVSLLLFKFLKI